MHVWEDTLDTYKCSLIPLDEVSVLPLVLLHPQLGVLHVNVVCQVIHYTEDTQITVNLFNPRDSFVSIISNSGCAGKFKSRSKEFQR